jgi:MYXO-CTERM domain-containing protein
LDVSHDHVFLLASHVDGGGGLCTATLIAPNLLLTARHCVSPGTEEDHVLCGDSALGKPFPAHAFIATNDPLPSMNSVLYRASEVRVLDEGTDTCGYDIALVVLNENVPTRVAAPATPRIDRDVSPGEQYTAVGYGENEDGELGGSRMQLDGLTIECRPGTCGEGVESTEFRGETGICSGDSGGPALDSDGKVVGVVSRGGPDCSTPVYGTVTAWRDFIVSGATEAALAGGYEPPFWVTTLSSEPPSSGAGGASGGAASGNEGDACQSSAACADGFVCFGNGTGVCRRTCEETADCGAGEVCEEAGGASLCVLPTTSADESGCTVTRSVPGSGRTSAAWGLLLLFGAARARRRRR